LPAPRRPLVVSDVPDGVFLYDGVCVLCSAWFRFVASRDSAIRFRFAQIQDPFGQRLADRLGIDRSFPETNAVIIEGVAYFRSDAALQVLSRLPAWRWTSTLRVVPRPLRDWLYDRVARNRYRLFGRTETCLIPDGKLMEHVYRERADDSGA
jgi:predicted DCC family thiol-disulfide oxidoreductase YuxK